MPRKIEKLVYSQMGAAYLKAFFKNEGITGTELAATLGVSDSTGSLYVSDPQKIPQSRAEALFKAYFEDPKDPEGSLDRFYDLVGGDRVCAPMGGLLFDEEDLEGHYKGDLLAGLEAREDVPLGTFGLVWAYCMLPEEKRRALCANAWALVTEARGENEPLASWDAENQAARCERAALERVKGLIMGTPHYNLAELEEKNDLRWYDVSPRTLSVIESYIPHEPLRPWTSDTQYSAEAALYPLDRKMVEAFEREERHNAARYLEGGDLPERWESDEERELREKAEEWQAKEAGPEAWRELMDRRHKETEARIEAAEKRHRESMERFHDAMALAEEKAGLPPGSLQI